MQMTTEARAWLDSTVRRILARHPLGDAERAGVTYELMSHLHAAGEARATAAGRSEVSQMDLELALVEAGGEEKLAAAFVQPLSKPLERVFLGRRVGAFLLDVFFLGIAVSFVHGALTYLLDPSAAHAETPSSGVPQFQWFLWLLPWGYHPMVVPWAQAVIAAASAALVLGYFTWTESHDGRSLGKRMLGLRVMRVDGRPMTPREALVRNVAKLAPALLILDVLAMLLAFPNDKQRASDRIAGTIVVRV